MGLYSSWASMALTNHALVRLAASRRGLDKFSEYMIVGDDIVIFDNVVAIEFAGLLSEIGVKTSTSDSIAPKSGSPLEICKRIFRGGIELTPLPLNLYKTQLSLFLYKIAGKGETFLGVPDRYPGKENVLIPFLAAMILVFIDTAPELTGISISKTWFNVVLQLAPRSGSQPDYWVTVCQDASTVKVVDFLDEVIGDLVIAIGSAE